MATTYTVRQGDCADSIAFEVGMNWKTIWQAPENADLRARRPSPNLLLPGDQIAIPDKTPKKESCPTSQRHRFKLNNTLVWLRLRFLDDDQPRGNLPYVLVAGAKEFRGQTNAEGKIEHQIPAALKEAVLRLGPPDNTESYILKLGALDPLDEPSGVQGRLTNLGYNCGEVDGIIGSQTKRALRLFQQEQDVEMTGKPDEATLGGLEEEHGS